MYVRFLTFKANPRRRSEVEALGDQVFKYVKTLKGFISVHFIISENANEYGSFSLWESRADAIAAGQSIRSKIGRFRTWLPDHLRQKYTKFISQEYNHFPQLSLMLATIAESLTK